MYIHRELEREVSPFLDCREAIAILGPRQCGKTTFLGEIVRKLESSDKKVHQITFENRGDLDLFDENIEDFKSLVSGYDTVVIDEFQYAKNGGKHLKYLYDTTEIKFIISGSSSLDLVFQTGKYMVGRLLEFTLLPFSFREYLSFREPDLFRMLEERAIDIPESFRMEQSFGEEIRVRLRKYLEQFVIYGGYPAVALAEDIKRKEKILESIASEYLLKDIESLLRLATSDKLRTLEKLLASQIGNLINYKELGISSGLAYNDLKEHLDILEKTYILSLVRPFSRHRRTELVRNPKVYFLDTGLRNFTLSDFRPIADRPDAGAVMENYAFTLLVRRAATHAHDIHFWRTKGGAEVDFVLERRGEIAPFEIKYSVGAALGKSVYSFIEKFQPKRFTILTRETAQEEKVGNTDIMRVPLSYF